MSDGKSSADSAFAAKYELYEATIRAENVATFLKTALLTIARAAGGSRALLVKGLGGVWTTVAQVGDAAGPGPSPDLFAETLDREAATTRDGWLALPIEHHAATGELVVVPLRDAASAGRVDSAVGRIEATLQPAVAALGEGLVAVRRSDHDRRRLEQLESLLRISAEWYRTSEMEPLLKQIAEATTKLLKSDRASIFLWDKPNRTLVARPALGVEGDELRVLDDRGVVGEVLRTKLPKRVTAREGREQIAREVDKRLGYETRTLLCVPLVSRSGELLGAFEAINKLSGDFTDDDEAELVELAAHAAAALENSQERERLLQAGRVLSEEAASRTAIVGRSPAIEALRSAVRRVADTDLAVLILGENGTGKEVVARSIHYLSARKEQPFVAVNCAAIAETLVESELFGHERGAFTDAHDSRPGKFELASGGTLFLDEIGDLSLGGQSKLLRVLEEKVVVRVGGSKSIHTDARVIAATNQNLAEMVRAKRFRQDLFFRLNVVSIHLPPLRDRPGDVVLLAEHFLQQFARRARRRTPQLSAAAKKRLEAHVWPGNVRELRNAMERLAYLCNNERIEPDDLAFLLAASGELPTTVADDLPLAEATDEFQKSYIKRAIEHAGDNMSDAAQRLGLHRSNLYRKMKQLDMPTS